jgi:hypothetical protein
VASSTPSKAQRSTDASCSTVSVCEAAAARTGGGEARDAVLAGLGVEHQEVRGRRDGLGLRLQVLDERLEPVDAAELVPLRAFFVLSCVIGRLSIWTSFWMMLFESRPLARPPMPRPLPNVAMSFLFDHGWNA